MFIVSLILSSCFSNATIIEPVSCYKCKRCKGTLDSTNATTKAYIDSILIVSGILPNNYAGTVTDIEGNVYKTVKIGTQIWMAENLRTSKFNDNTLIPLVINETQWGALTTPAFCLYGNEKLQSYQSVTYGFLYNWYAVNTDKLCPTAWHVPTDREWTILTTYLGGESVAGGKLKETGTSHWSPPNAVATNESGFTALAGGIRAGTDYWSIGYWAHLWSSTENSIGDIWYRVLTWDSGAVYRYSKDEIAGNSVRCMKDQ